MTSGRGYCGWWIAVWLIGCGGGGGGSGNDATGGPTINATVRLYQGAVNASALAFAPAPLVADGHWTLVPNQMTATVAGACFVPMGQTHCGTTPFTSPCTATFDPTKGSIAQLGQCPLSTTAGTYVGVQIDFSTTYQVLIDDATRGIYTDPSQSTLLSSTMPAGGAQMVTFHDTNSPGQATISNVTYFPMPRTFTATDSPALSIIFDPTHWLRTVATGGAFSDLVSSGSPPIHATLDSPGKAMLLNVYDNNNEHGAGNIVSGPPPGALTEAKIFFADAAGTMPIALDGPVEVPSVQTNSHLCNINGPVFDGAWPGAPMSCSMGSCFGIGGYLGVDASGVITWAAPADDWNYASYAMVLQMQLPTTVGATTTLSYVCTATAPMPANGTTYTTAPDLSTLGTVQTIPNVMLVAD